MISVLAIMASLAIVLCVWYLVSVERGVVNSRSRIERVKAKLPIQSIKITIVALQIVTQVSVG